MNRFIHRKEWRARGTSSFDKLNIEMTIDEFAGSHFEEDDLWEIFDPTAAS
jgi:hypothetical protein